MPRCPQCKLPLASVHEVEGTSLVVLFSCVQCDYRGKIEMDLSFNPEEYKLKGKGVDQIIIDDPEVP